MAYQTGSATSPTDLLQQLVTWLVARGWTQDMNQADGVGWRAHLHKSGFYINLRAVMNDTGLTSVWAGSSSLSPSAYSIGLYAGTGFNSSNGWNAQAGGPIGSGQTYTVGASCPFTSAISITGYHFFDDGNDNITVVVERAPGIFVHFGWGNFTKAGAVTGGAYFFAPSPGFYQAFSSNNPGAYGGNTSALCPFCDTDSVTGSYYSSFVRADVDTFTGKWLGTANAGGLGVPQGYTGRNSASVIPGGPAQSVAQANVPHYGTFASRQTSSQNLQANLLPIHLFVPRDAGGWSLLGTIPSLYYSDAVGDGNSAKDEIQIGSDTYKLFPNFAVKKV
jgi:hypothetical protein